MKHSSLERIRGEIGEKDREILKLLNERASLSIIIGKIKEAQGKDVFDPVRERLIMDRLMEFHQGPLPDAAVRGIFHEILSASRNLQAPLTVTYLGPEGTFSHLAVLRRFGSGEKLLPVSAISQAFDEVEKGKAGLAMVPVENSMEGSVKHTLDRLISTTLKIQGEVLLRISHNLMSRCYKLDDIKRVYSHSQALAQCQGWLHHHVLTAVFLEVASTADAAKKALEDPCGAAIGSQMASSAYGLQILAEGIEDDPSNTTRFLILGKGLCERSGVDKTSLVFGTPHVPGGLYRSLEPFAAARINMTRIESYPVRGKAWEYLFFVDFSGHQDDEIVRRCLRDMQERTTLMKILGSYPKGEEP
jgi:chorismate mutase/prephenate dehydratase